MFRVEEVEEATHIKGLLLYTQWHYEVQAVC